MMNGLFHCINIITDVKITINYVIQDSFSVTLALSFLYTRHIKVLIFIRKIILFQIAVASRRLSRISIFKQQHKKHFKSEILISSNDARLTFRQADKTQLLKGVFTIFDVEHMLNPPVSNVPPERIFLGHPFGLQVQNELRQKTIKVNFSPN